MEKYGRTGQGTDDIIERMRVASWITKATDTLRICNTYTFPRRQWLRERASMLYVHCLSSLNIEGHLPMENLS